jgi:hypothetical protein
MTDSEGLTHDLCWLLGIMCRCPDCTNSREIRLVQDIRLFWNCNTVEEVEAKRREHGR